MLSRGVLPDKQSLAKFVFLEEINSVEGAGPIGIQPDPEFRSNTIHDNKFIQLQKEVAMQAAMNSNMPMAKGIVDTAFLEKNRVVKKRKAVNPLGNFWKQNLDQIFKDF